MLEILIFYISPMYEGFTQPGPRVGLEGPRREQERVTFRAAFAGSLPEFGTIVHLDENPKVLGRAQCCNHTTQFHAGMALLRDAADFDAFIGVRLSPCAAGWRARLRISLRMRRESRPRASGRVCPTVRSPTTCAGRREAGGTPN